VYLISAMLTIGGVRRRAWIGLRDCRVELDPRTDAVPSIVVDGMQIESLGGHDLPRIEVVDARVRL
jgi:hypothetical protein